MLTFLNDAFVENPKVSLMDLGLLRGFGAFEFGRVYDGHFFRLDDHLERFFLAASGLGLKVPYAKDEIKNLSFQLISKNGLSDCGVKFILTGGFSSNGFDRGVKPTFAILTCSISKCPASLKVKTAQYKRFFPLFKTLNYMPAILERNKAVREGFDEPLFLDEDGFILEGARENFFAIKKGVLITPAEDVLLGITRQVTLEIAKEMMAVEERKIHYDELKDCEEAFFTSTVREIAPIRAIDDLHFCINQTKALQKLFVTDGVVS